TTVTFNAIQSVGSGWANSAGVITIPYSGPYLFTLGAMWLANGSATGSVRRLIITRNGTTERILDNHIVATAATADHAMTFTGSRTLTAGDTIRWRVLHNGGVSLSLGPLSSGDFYTRVQYLGPS